MSYDFTTGDLMARLEAWERVVTTYETNVKEAIKDDIKIGILLMRMPNDELGNHMVMHADSLWTWPAFKDGLVHLWQGAKDGGGAPMDVVALTGKGKKGKGKNGKETRSC